MDRDEKTETSPRGERSRDDGASAPHLFFLMDCERPLLPSRRFLLDVDSVRVGRGNQPGHRRAGRSLTIEVADRRASLAHAQLERVLGNWMVEDLGSKNGTLVNGDPIERAELADGDLLELGSSFFLFRAGLPVDPEEPASGGDEGSDARLRTFHPALAGEFRRLRAIAGSSVSLVILGESGTGKEVMAEAVHRLSNRGGVFQAVNCAAIPAALIESELFGHRRGAFSGATEDRKGLIAGADGGTLFLDEIGDLPASAQIALLRVLQESTVHPVGAARPFKVDLRVIAATHRDIAVLVQLEKFRADLLARLAGYTLQLPPVRERREDLGMFIATLLRRLLGPKAEAASFSVEAARTLLRHPWPLNVRELEKCLHAAVVLAGDGPILLRHLPAALSERAALPAAEEKRREELIALLRQHAGNVTAVAQAMGKARMQIQRWLKRYRIDAAEYRR